ncbi:MAG: hypothetical protein AAF401_06440 [Pseudomonadota bacterium]
MSIEFSRFFKGGLGTLTAAVTSIGLLASCGGADSTDGGSDDGTTFAEGTRFDGLIDFPALEALTSAEVQLIIAQALNEANAQGAPATIAISDRVGNVLAVFQMTGAPVDLAAFAEVPRTINQGPQSGTVLNGADGSGLDGFTVPSGAALGAIAKAVTGAYLSSSGNAFTTRTASQIVQENFNPEETFQAGGPLFGVQFSQLACSDLSTRFESDNGAGTVVGSTVGPKRSPLGLSADPGGLPIYKNGVVVGGIGVIADGNYTIDLTVVDIDSDAEMQDELIALAGITGFEAPEGIRAFTITVEGNSLRYTDTVDDRDRLRADPAAAPGFAAVLGAQGALLDVNGYYDVPTGTAADVLAGNAYGAPESGYVAATSLPNGSPFSNPNAFVLVNAAGNPRFSPKAAGDTPGGDAANALTRAEVIQMIDEALGVALAGRAQIRRPLNSRIQVTVSVVDTNGEILGVARTPDGPIFGTDVSLQKARTAMFFSSETAGDDLAAVPAIDSQAALASIGILDATGNLIPDSLTAPTEFQKLILNSGQSYVDAARTFVGPTALRGRVAFSDRGNGNLSRPFFPDGVNETQTGQDSPHGPFSRPFNSADTTQNWSPFSTGLQFDLVGPNVLQHVLFTLGLTPDSGVGCSSFAGANLLPVRDGVAFPFSPLANGAQIFAGSVPVYRNGTLIGGLGVSGDGIDQDDMISSLGLRRAGIVLGNGLGHAPERIRSDTVVPAQGNGNRLRYVSCPFAPFIDSDVQTPCEQL